PAPVRAARPRREPAIAPLLALARHHGRGLVMSDFKPWSSVAEVTARFIMDVLPADFEEARGLVADAYAPSPIEVQAMAEIAHVVSRAHVELLDQVAALRELVDQTDPTDPIGVALTKVGLARPPGHPPVPVEVAVDPIEPSILATYCRVMHVPEA